MNFGVRFELFLRVKLTGSGEGFLALGEGNQENRLGVIQSPLVG